MSGQRNAPRCVALVVPAWPVDALPNGIITYTAQMLPALRGQCVRPIVLSWQLGAELSSGINAAPDDEVIDISASRIKRSFVNRAVQKLRRQLPFSDFAENRFPTIERAVAGALNRFPIELVEMEEAFGLPARVVGMRRLPVVTRLHGPWFVNGDVLGVAKDAAFERRLRQERRAIAIADAVSAPSQDILDRTRAFYDLPLADARVIPYPVAERVGEPAWRASDCDPNRIVFVGRFDRHKGADVLFEAFARLAASRPALRLDFIGPDRTIPDASGRLMGIGPWIERHVADADIRRRIIVHGQQTAAAAAASRLRGALTVVPSRYETFGYTAVEAMSQGCPLVAADTGGLAEIVRDSHTGLLFRCGDAHSLASQVERLLAAPDFAARLGEQAQVDVRHRYHPATIAMQTIEFYASVIDGWHANARRPTAQAARI